MDFYMDTIIWYLRVCYFGKWKRLCNL